MSRTDECKKKNYQKPSWLLKEEKIQKNYKENEEKNKKFSEIYGYNIDMGGGSRDSESESSWYGMDTN